VAGEFTELQIFKFAPAIAAQPFESLSLGLALHVDYANLDLRNGSSAGYAFGVQAGAIYKIMDDLSFGVNFVSPQSVDHENVLKAQNEQFDLELESPLQVGAGLAYTTLGGKLLLETDVKWLNWADADGYGDFGWDNQWVFAVGAQYKPISKLALRAGYNYGKNPVKEHNGWNGADPVSIQGITLPKYFFESFRVIGFPAIVEHHVTAGIGYEFTPRFALNLGYMHAFENTITEKGTDFFGNPAEFESTLSQDSVDFGLTWRF
jgi:long-chain fatty acid transport protein